MAKLTPEQLAEIAERVVSAPNWDHAEKDMPVLLDHIKALEEDNARLINRIKEVGELCTQWYREANEGYSIIGALRKELAEFKESTE